MAEPQFQVYEDQAGEWRWRLRASNARIIADSSEGYENNENLSQYRLTQTGTSGY